MDPILKAFEDHAEARRHRCGKCKVELKDENKVRCEKCGPIWPI